MNQKLFFKNKSILITGGTGSLGKELTSHFLKNKYPLKKIIIFSRDELKQSEMKKFFFKKDPHNLLRFFLGDIRDKERLDFAFEKVDIIIHTAALKHVDASEYNPLEFIKTNIIGAQNIIDCSLRNNVQNVIALSTDKASSPINLYGATKLCSDKLFINSNNIRGNKKIKFSVVRYGNVMGSRGSVFHSFVNQSRDGELLLTDEKMTRFFINLEDAVIFVLRCLNKMNRGEIFIPKMPSIKIVNLIKAIYPNARMKNIGVRPGEKIDELLISANESCNVYEFSDHFIILSSISSIPIKQLKKFLKKGKLVKTGFMYSSNNSKFLSLREIKRLIPIL